MVIGIASFVLALGLGVFSWLKVPAWKQRDFGQRNFKWKTIIIASSLFSIASSVGVCLIELSLWHSYSLWACLTVGLVGYITVLASVTDFALLKIPSDITGAGILVLLPFVAIFWPSLDHLYMLVWLIFVIFFAVMSLLRFMGWADVELLAIFGLAFSGWVDILTMTYGLIVAVIIQLILTPLAGPLKLGVKKKLGERTEWNSETKKMETVIEEAVEEDFIGEHPKRSTQKRNLQNSKKKERTHLPFGPALLIAYMGVAVYSVFQDAPYIYSWWG